ncbi:hypothetical protein A3Q56_02770 [Intoshia linei]|uniref:Cilium assembly protein DZIP1 N-terminal domain-containing protein n=1 Tax=Intoshia linei TaxID=1819745 RepID=A0A177B5Q4_9BILA|nr:hypothetical protein A3Q56_02770 [Intoshia linei]
MHTLKSHGISESFDAPDFCFKYSDYVIDWKQIAALDLPAIRKITDISVLQQLINEIAYSNISKEINVKEQNTLTYKLFSVSQVIIQYLLFDKSQSVCISKKVYE